MPRPFVSTANVHVDEKGVSIQFDAPPEVYERIPWPEEVLTDSEGKETYRSKQYEASDDLELIVVPTRGDA